MNIEFKYMYRDGGNFKTGGSVVFKDAPDDLEAAKTELRKALDEGEWFIASQVGVPEVFSWDPHADYDPDDERTFPADLGPGKYCIWDDCDHCWHEFMDLVVTDQEPTDERTWSAFLVCMQQAKAAGWQVFDPASRR